MRDLESKPPTLSSGLRWRMRIRLCVRAGALCVMLAACRKAKNGDVVIQRPTGIVTSPDTLHLPSIGTKPETVVTPTVTTKPETMVVKKPIVGSKKAVLRRPVVKP